jgi:hypothetical protein
VLEIKK